MTFCSVDVLQESWGNQPSPTDRISVRGFESFLKGASEPPASRLYSTEGRSSEHNQELRQTLYTKCIRELLGRVEPPPPWTWMGVVTFIHHRRSEPGCRLSWARWWGSAPGGLCGWLGWARGDVMGCRNSKVLPEPPGDVQLDLVKKVSKEFCCMWEAVISSQHLTCSRQVIIDNWRERESCNILTQQLYVNLFMDYFNLNSNLFSWVVMIKVGCDQKYNLFL